MSYFALLRGSMLARPSVTSAFLASAILEVKHTYDPAAKFGSVANVLTQRCNSASKLSAERAGSTSFLLAIVAFLKSSFSHQ